ncbi:MAG: amino acid ABC transporter permease [Clostridiales bacterium]|jgi:ABC-type amino acid transport system permease subunit|uniref:amino acid ABC transporter permease n=1 Tax=Bovifimicola ammoniilytica TaxID=2981720 RepID=UPI00033B6C55|nr:amino acid ABC transporter permease [Bovifimicola ammoniilytica]MBD8941228.1 amino acid ABC transporter permease [Clostridiales bacterium]MDD6293558.1 amino acid ABC transporter permease [Eubacteriales bacterium]MDY2606414.1 amino acid ABC transporter permease [Lachnospiraceae bacterium]CCZ04734.1 aBC transporter permease protein [Eubacterium sp. CAG:603]SCJ29653.1 Arginine transport system permease protein ArtQ [uncultured Eubacterium sp.]
MAEFKRKFTQNFIDDHRYRYLLDGLKETLIIAVCAVIIGILIGFIVAIIRSTHDKNHSKKKGFSRFIIGLLNFICKVYLTIIRGTPVLVQLLISFYCIFTAPDTSKTFVAIMAFGINSGAYVAEIVRSGIMSIDNGQFEAGRSLGFNYIQTMVFIVLPQAFKNVLPALSNEFIVLLKETSVAGYIGIQDLTKGGDFIRSRTFEPLFPLIAVAIIYLIIVMILTSLVSKLERRLRNSDH